MRSRVNHLASLILLTAVAVSAAGCSAPKAIETAWPEAKAERVVARPPGPPRWPLTGLEAPSAEAVTSRIVAVKIDNSSAARPQLGLQRADVVYETLTEGGITRFNALFHSDIPAAVGPVRSARPSDLHIVPQYHALLAHVGGDSGTRESLKDKSRFEDMDQFFNPSAYRRTSDRSAPHNMLLDIAKLRASATSKRGFPASATVTPLAFARSVGDATPTVTVLTIPFSSSNKVEWSYDADSRTYRRSVNGRAHKDAATGRRLSARNVVVLWTQIRSTGRAGGQLLEVTLTGSGRTSVFRGGERIDGVWETSGSEPPVFRTSDGRAIRLDPGNTWFQVIANDRDILMK